MRGRRETRWHRRLPVYPLILAIAAFWLLLTVLVLGSIQPAEASSRQGSSPNIAASATPLLTATILPTILPTKTPTATPASTATTAPTGTVPPTQTPTATATTPSGNSGGGGGTQDGGGGNGPSSAGPSVTRVVFSQPTVAAGNDSAVPGLAGATFGSNGLLVAGTMSCMVGLLGLTVAGIALSVLVRRGYGPYLRALLRGKRAGRQRGKKGANGQDGFGDGGDSPYLPGAAYGGNRIMASGQYQPEPYARNGQAGAYRAPAQSRSPRQSPATRSRTGWR